MFNTFADMPPRDPDSGLVNVIIDTPRGSRNNYKYDETLRCFRLSRILPGPLLRSGPLAKGPCEVLWNQLA